MRRNEISRPWRYDATTAPEISALLDGFMDDVFGANESVKLNWSVYLSCAAATTRVQTRSFHLRRRQTRTHELHRLRPTEECRSENLTGGVLFILLAHHGQAWNLKNPHQRMQWLNVHCTRNNIYILYLLTFH